MAKVKISKPILSLKELFLFLGEDYYFFFKRNVISIKDAGHVIFRFTLSEQIKKELIDAITKQGHDLSRDTIGLKPISVKLNGEILRVKLNYNHKVLSSLNFRRSKDIFDFDSYLNHSLFLKFLQQLFLKGKSFIISGETGSGKTTFILSLLRYLNSNDIEEFKRKGYMNLLINSQIQIDPETPFEECLKIMDKMIENKSIGSKINDYDQAILANPIVPVIEKMQNTFILTLENPVEYDLVSESDSIDFEQIETDDYSLHLVSTVTTNPNMLYLSEVRTVNDYLNFLLVSAQGKQLVTTNHAENVFENIQKMISYIGNEKMAKQNIISGVGGFIHFQRYYPEGYYIMNSETKQFELRQFGVVEDEFKGEIITKRDSVFLVSYEYLSFMNEDIKLLFQNEDDLQNFKTRVNNSYFYIPTDATSAEEGKSVMLYLPHEVSLLYNMFLIYKKYRFIPKINVYGMKFSGTVRGALEQAFLYYGKDKELLTEFLEYFRMIYKADLNI